MFARGRRARTVTEVLDRTFDDDPFAAIVSGYPEALRSMVRETELNPRDFIYPLFVRHGKGRTPIASMPGIAQLSIEEAVWETEKAAELNIPAVILFGIPVEKERLGGICALFHQFRFLAVRDGWYSSSVTTHRSKRDNEEGWFSRFLSSLSHPITVIAY